MELLKKIFSGERKNSLIISELKQIVNECYSSKTLTERSKNHLYIEKGIERGIINDEHLLLVSILGLKNINDISLIILSLRHNSNKNLYVLTPGVGSAHIIIYIVVILKSNTNVDVKILNEIISILILIFTIMGSQTNSLAFNQNKPEEEHNDVDNIFIKNILPQEEEKPKNKEKKLTVQDWLKSQGFPSFSGTTEELLNDKPDLTKIDIAILCDRPDLLLTLKDINYNLNLDNIILSRSFAMLKLYDPKKDVKNMFFNKGEYTVLIKSIETGCYESFAKIFDNETFLLSYFTITRLVLNMRSAFLLKDNIYLEELQEMLKYGISNGSHIDFYQMSILSTTSTEIANNILKEYKKPMWKKVCSNPKVGAIPDELKVLSSNLNIESLNNKEALCFRLNSYYVADQDELKKATIARQRARISADITNISDFVGTEEVNPELATCQNRTLLDTDPLEYNDASLSYYKDEDGHVWCFLSNMYKSLLDESINPNTSKPLPENFKDQIRSHITILDRLGIPLSDPKTINSAIDDLHKDDEISGKESLKIVSTIEQTAEISKIDVDKMRKLTPEKMNNILNTINMDQYSIDLQDINGNFLLTKEHQYITFCRAAYFAIKSNVNNSKLFFTNLQLNL